MTKASLAEWAKVEIGRALSRNMPYELIVVAILSSISVAGIFLLLSGTANSRWELLASGAACEVAVGWPVSSLLKMRKFNMLLQVVPALIDTADTESRKELTFAFIKKLTERM